MPFNDVYRRQVALLLRVIPALAKEKCFALKGGTAINLFVRDLPRLSVDIDLTYLPVSPRSKSLPAIDKAMTRAKARIEKAIPAARVTPSLHDGATTKLTVRERDVQIKIEVTPVLRGCAYEPEIRSVTAAVEAAFGFAEMRVVSFADLYAGKLVAALDRQHPRDLFDVRDLLANEGIDDALRQAFIVYLISHNRPMSEVLGAPQKDIAATFHNSFDGMTDAPVSLDALLAARAELVAKLVGGMPRAHRRFLMSFEAGEPDWSLLAIPGARKLPAVKWRMQNLDAIARNKRIALVSRLGALLDEAVPSAQYSLFAEPQKKRRRSSI